MESPIGRVVERGFRLHRMKSLGVMFTLDDLTEEDLTVLEIIEAERPRQGG
jgi:hypothetical protein